MASSYLEEYTRVSAAGGSFLDEVKKERFKPQNKFAADCDIVIAPSVDNSPEALAFKGFAGAKIAIINLSGALMKEDFCGQLGTQSILTLFDLADTTESVEDIVIVIDSPGGTVDGTFALADAIAECTKKVTAIIDGMCCSAAYWIASGADEIFASAPTNIIGSIGTMIQLYDKSKCLENQGVVLRTYNADDSVNKNTEFSEALKGNGKLLVKNLLNPINDEFIAGVTANRPDVNKEALTGKVYIGKAALTAGLIDGIKCMDDIIAEIKAQKKVIINSQQIKSIMTPFEKTLKAASATQFTLVEGGFMLNEANLTNIEAALTGAEALQASVKESKTEAATATAALATANAAVIDLQARVIDMSKNDGARFSAPVAGTAKEEKDTTIGAVVTDNSAFETEYDKELKAMQNRAKI